MLWGQCFCYTRRLQHKMRRVCYASLRCYPLEVMGWDQHDDVMHCVLVSVSLCLCLSLSVCMWVYVCKGVDIFICVSLHVCAWVWASVCVCVCKWVHVWLVTHMGMYCKMALCNWIEFSQFSFCLSVFDLVGYWIPTDPQPFHVIPFHAISGFRIWTCVLPR